MLRGGSWNAIEMMRCPSARPLPVRRKNGTPAQRQLSISHLSAMNVSVSDSGDDAVFVAVAAVLPAHHVARVKRRIERNTLFFSSLMAAGRKLGGRFHRDERQNLEQVGDHHVLESPDGFVELGAVLDSEPLGHIDLDVVDEVAVPDRLEQAVGEAESQDVLRGFLAQEVVDPEDLFFVESLVYRPVELSRALAKSTPNGFSMMTREFSAKSALCSVSITAITAFGGTLR
jgi:hypothetical protein